jgi:hypothetical protein
MKYLKTFELNKTYTYDEVKELIDEFIKEEFGFVGSFCNGHYYRKPGNKHIQELKIYLKRIGINLDTFMKNNMNIILDDDYFVAANGFMDYLVYTYDKSFLLSGVDCMDTAEEISIKYEYGYQNTKIGRIYLKQAFGTLANFYKKHIEYCILDLNSNKNDYIIETYDKNNIFLFTCDKNYLSEELLTRLKGEELFGENNSNLIMFKIKNILVFIFGNLKIMDEKTLDKYVDYADIIEKLEFQSAITKYNL